MEAVQNLRCKFKYHFVIISISKARGAANSRTRSSLNCWYLLSFFSAACSAWRLPRPVFPQSFTAPARHLLFKSPPTQRQIAHHRRRPARRVGTTRFSPTCVARIWAGRSGEYIWYLFLRHLMMDVIWISFLEYQWRLPIRKTFACISNTISNLFPNFSHNKKPSNHYQCFPFMDQSLCLPVW